MQGLIWSKQQINERDNPKQVQSGLQNQRLGQFNIKYLQLKQNLMKSTIKIALFLSLLYLTYQGSFQCNVQGCLYCSYPNVCGQCMVNNLLVWNNLSNIFSCSPLTCSPNCNICYKNNSCQICSSGYFIAQNGSCQQQSSSSSNISSNCLWGNGPQICNLCAYGYSLQSGYCYPIYPLFTGPNCTVAQALQVCQICNSGYIVGPQGFCIPIGSIDQTTCNTQNCAYCTDNTNSSCSYCLPGYRLTSLNTCTNSGCNSVGCATCGSNGQCSGCLIGYNFNISSKNCSLIGYGCSDSNCLICDSSQSCGQCIPGYHALPFNSNGLTVKLCRPLACPYQIQNCQSCTYQYTTQFAFQQVLCSVCNSGYSLVNGYCVVKLQSIGCSVSNCQQCSFPNFCSQCAVGYVLTIYGTCIQTQCANTDPNCASCGSNFVCQQCKGGYTLALQFLSISLQITPSIASSLLTAQCIPSSITCNIQNCGYCLSNNVCSSCANGYDFASQSSSSPCIPICNTQNCFQCSESSSSVCLTCNPGYTLSSDNKTCTAINYACSGCQSSANCFYNWQTQQGVCSVCSSGMILYQGQCYNTTCNIYGCSQCKTWTNPPTCLKCNQGLLLTAAGYCWQFNCNNNVANCILCVQNNICLGCQSGYLLVNTSGTTSCQVKPSCIDPNCLECSNSSTCTKCAMPYNLSSNGACVCGFQNCLSCTTSGIACDSCSFPLFGSLSTQGCVPIPNIQGNCQVLNCRYCLTQNQCSICAVGYSLVQSNLTCSLNVCPNNCSLCDALSNLCHQCNAGFMLNNLQQGGNCVPVNSGYSCNITGCDVCSSTNNSVCSMCLPTFYANSSTQCLPYSCNIPNCFLCLQSNLCSQCVNGFYLTVGSNNQQICVSVNSNISNCQGKIQNCAMCVVNLVSSNNQNYCVQCMDGYQFDSTNTICVPQTNTIPHCKVQQNLGTQSPPYCTVCEQGYFLNTWGLCSIYNPNTNNTNCSIYNCLYCGYNSSQCSYCFANWAISPSGQCQTNFNCSSNCQFCANSNSCLTCASSYTLNGPNTCVLCQILNCQLCQQQNSCFNCATGYTLTSGNLCLSCNIQSCTNCSNSNVCSTCSSNSAGASQYPSPTGSACYTCDQTLPNMANCSSCSGPNSCGLCLNGQLYTPPGGTGVCIQCNIANCQTCSLNGNTVVCSSCLASYSLNGGNCIQCLYPCATCNSNQSPNCATCQSPFYFATALSNGSCVSNTIPNCADYNTSNILLCSSCNTGYTLNTDSNTCSFNCPVNCQSCNGGTCTQCANGFYLPNNNTCTQCQVTGCISCPGNGQTCQTCFTGFYLMSGQCKACPGYCSNCQSISSCSSLVQSNQQVLVTVNNVQMLAVCSQNCISCSGSNPQICLQCSNGFYLSNGNCFSCSSNCLTCSTTNQNQCLTCYPNSFLSGGSCNLCSSNCLTCQSSNQPNVCLSCNDGYYLNNNVCIQNCPLDCSKCSSPNICTQCMSGYTLFNQNSQTFCAPCTTSCRTCAQGQPASCLSCGTGFYLSGSTCIQCSINCNTCTASGCISCVNGFFLTSTQSCSQNCVLPCATCSATTPTACTSCIAGYSYNDVSNTCNQIITCNGPCVVCPLGYTLNAGKCIQCTASSCQTCNPTAPSQCYSCLPGFFLNSNQCQGCTKNCTTCLTSNGCLTCAIGYTWIANSPITPAGYQCLACNSPCATCLNDPNYCTSCVQGYQFFGWKCAQSFYFGFQVTLLVNFTIFNQNYYNFILALASAISASTPNSITILSISSGSVIVNGGAGPTGSSGSKQVNQQFNSFEAALSANNQIAGMPIGSSSVTVVGGNVDYKQVNLALILGICIPVGVLIIVGIVLFIYCKKKKSADVIEQKVKEDSGFTVRQSFQLSANYKDQESQKPFENTTAIN